MKKILVIGGSKGIGNAIIKDKRLAKTLAFANNFNLRNPCNITSSPLDN